MTKLVARFENKVLVATLHRDKRVTEKLVPIVESSVTVNGVVFPIQTRNAWKTVVVKGGVYIPSVTLFGDKIISGGREAKDVVITEDNLFMRFFRAKGEE